MWERWKKRIANLFFTEVIEEEEVERKPRDINSLHDPDVHTKVVYKYPNRNSFHFPVIPDNPNLNRETDRPAFERKSQRRDKYQNRVRERPLEQTYRRREDPAEQKEEPEIVQKSSKQVQPRKEPFQPSEVPSPIYGFHNRHEEKELEDIPAFVRYQQPEIVPEESETEEISVSAENEVAAGQMESITAEELDPEPAIMETESSEIHDAIDTGTEEIQSIEPTYENNDSIVVDRKPEEQSSYSDRQEQEIQQPNEEANKQSPGTSPNSGKQRNKRKQMNRQNNQNANSSIPFNVMMSANDKRHHERKQRVGSIHPIATKQKTDIPYHLLNDPVPTNSQDQIWVAEQKELLEETLKHFHVKAKVVNATQGPSVTRFEVHPDMGVKVSKIKNLSDDLKLNMAAKDIRIEAPIPGKNTVGIEIPNPKPQMVGLQEIFATEAFKNSQSPLTIALGLTIEGSPLITNIKKMPHGLIAGATGSGKSVCINTILISLIYKANYKDVKFLLIDPKMVELAPFNSIPHLVAPVITDVKAATQSLKWAVNEMEDRYEKFVQEGVRDIERYNQKMNRENRPDDKMPFLVIVIDELADLMMVAPQDVEDAICRIAQKARACGIHLLLATQRPSVDVITGLIKANIPTRIAFSVSSQVDSRTIIDTSGAEKLLGKGDMLFVENGAGKSVRLQGAFVSDDEIERVTKYARSIAPAEYLFEQDDLLEQVAVDGEVEDDLLEEAIRFVVQQNSASTSLLQRHFKIGYNRAARLMDTMELKGIIAQQNGSKPREVLISDSQLSME